MCLVLKKCITKMVGFVKAFDFLVLKGEELHNSGVADHRIASSLLFTDAEASTVALQKNSFDLLVRRKYKPLFCPKTI